MIDFGACEPRIGDRFAALPANVREFWNELPPYGQGGLPEQAGNEPARAEKLSKEWVYRQSGLPWLKLPLDLPAAEMLAEAQGVLDRFAWHRSDSSQGWTSLCLRGLSARQTLSAKAYGHASEREAPYVWTEIAELCPITAQYFQTQFQCDTLFRVRYMLLAAGGHIAPHQDRQDHRLSGVNIALNNPPGCLFGMRGGGVLPIEPGDAFLLDTANEHSVINLSDTPRMHMIVHCADPTPAWNEMVCASYLRHVGQYCGQERRAA